MRSEAVKDMEDGIMSDLNRNDDDVMRMIHEEEAIINALSVFRVKSDEEYTQALGIQIAAVMVGLGDRLDETMTPSSREIPEIS